MLREDKVSLVESLNEAFTTTPHYVLASFTKLTANQANDLRRKVSSAGGSYRVITNRLAKRAAAGTPVESLAAQFSGPCALAMHETDPVILAKTLSDFVKDNPEIEVRAGMIGHQAVLDVAGVKQLALLPGLQELRAQLLAMILAPATTLVRLISTPATQLTRVLDAHVEAQSGTPADGAGDA